MLGNGYLFGLSFHVYMPLVGLLPTINTFNHFACSTQTPFMHQPVSNVITNTLWHHTWML